MELWDLYDEQGQKTGETWERSRAREIPEDRYHIVCDVLIRHQDGEFLLTLRDPEKDIYPGCLEASAGGSALAGELIPPSPTRRAPCRFLPGRNSLPRRNRPLLSIRA